MVLKACKKVSDMLPFSEKIELLSSDAEILKNLFLSASICPPSVEMILEALLEQFSEDSMFMDLFW